MQAEILLTLKLQQKLFADPRRISLLKHIALSGSISQGAKDAGISYKSCLLYTSDAADESSRVD
ncbi:hypothetical protein KQJ25_32670, partial [Escherichia sp. S69_ASV_4]|nr:hypothetical protein [Escherichia sp. S69_ASV_4]